MALPIVIAKNQTAGDIYLPRTGLTIPASSQLALTDFASFYEISWEDTLRTQVASLDVVINDGTSDLSAAKADVYLAATGNLTGPTAGLVDNVLLKLDGTTGRYTKATGIVVDALDNMDLGAGDITTTGIITGGTGALNVSVTPTADYIPRADSNAYLDPGWVAKAQVVTVALSGSADFTSVAAANASIVDASTVKPYTIKVASGIYVESPFTLKSNVAIIGESMLTTEIQTNDNNNHFITGATGAMLKNLAIRGPTGTGFAAINHTAAGTTPLQIHHCLLRAGYYGIWCHPAASRGVVHAFFVGNWYSGSRMENFFRASDFGNITAVVCNYMNGANSSVGTGFYCTGPSAEMTLDECNHRNKGSDNNIYVDDGGKIRAMAFAFSRGLYGIHIGPNGTNSRVYAAGCTMRRDVDTQTITAFSDYSGTVPGTTLCTSASHGMLTGAHAIITSAAPGTYDGHRIITKVDNNSFYITVAFAGNLVPATYTVGAIQSSNIIIDPGANAPIVEFSGGTINTRHISDGGVGTQLALGASELPEGGGSGSFIVFDELKVGTLAGTIPVGHYLRDTGFSGYFSGGEVTDAGGLTVDVALGTGWINVGTGLEPVDWDAQPGVVLADDSENYIYIDSNGVVQTAPALPSLDTNIVIAEVITAGGVVIMNATHRVPVAQRGVLFHEYAREVLQNRWVSGLTVTATAPASLGFEVDSGVFYLADYRLSAAASASPCGFTLLYRDGGGGWIAITGYSSGTVTVVNAPLAAGDTITIGGVTLTGVAGARTPGADDFDASLGTTGGLATEIAAAINDVANSFAATVSAVANLSTVTITSVAPGIGGDSITLVAATTPAGGLTVSGPNLTGGNAGLTEVPLTWDDNSGTPVPLAAGEWVKHMSWASVGDDGTQWFVQMGQEVFVDQATAETGNNPSPFDFLEDDACRLYGLVLSDASTNIESFVRAIFEIGTGGGGGTTGTSDHSALTNLNADDHLQYGLRTGNAARNSITGTFDFGAGGLLLPLAAIPAQTANGSAVWDSDDFRLTIGDGTTRKSLMNQGDTAGGNLSGTYPNPSVVGLTITGQVQGSTLYYNGASWVQLSPGTSGQYLRTQGTGANPLWAQLGIRSTGTGAFDVLLANTENLTANRTLTLTLNNASRTVNLGGNLTLADSFTTSGAFPITFTATGATSLTLPTSGTLLSDSTSTLQIAYNNGPSIVTAAATDILFTLTSGGFTVNGAGTIALGNGATAQTVSLGTGAGVKTVTVGSTNTTSSLDLRSGTGAMTLTAGGILDVNATGAVTVDGPGISIDGTAASNFSVTGANLSIETLTSGTLAVSSAGALNLSGTTGDWQATGALTLDSSGGAISIGGDADAQAINIGTGAAARTITIGNVTGATAVVVNAGTGASSWTVTGAGTFDLVAGTGTINLATNATDHSTLLGSVTGTSALTLRSGTGAQTFTAGGAFDVNATGALTLDSSGGAISIGGDADAQAINIGTGAAARTITVGNVTGATAVVVNAGTGASSWTVTGAGTFDLVAGTGTVNLATNATDHSTLLGSTTGTSALTLQSGTGAQTFTAGGAFDVNAAGAVTIDSSGGTIGIGTDAVAQNINIGTGASARTITVGNAASTLVGLVGTAIDLTAGAGNVNIVSSALEFGGTVALTSAGVLNADANHGTRGGGTLHADANGTTAGFMTAANFTKLSNIATGAMRAVLTWGNQDVAVNTTTRYLQPGYGTITAGTLEIVLPVTTAGVVRNLSVKHRVAAGNGNNIVYTVMKNGVATALTVTVASNSTTVVSDTTNNFSVASGDVLSLRVTKAAGIGTSPTEIVATAEYGAA
jgi:hypothetical protein